AAGSVPVAAEAVMTALVGHGEGRGDPRPEAPEAHHLERVGGGLLQPGERRAGTVGGHALVLSRRAARDYWARSALRSSAGRPSNAFPSTIPWTPARVSARASSGRGMITPATWPSPLSLWTIGRSRDPPG